MDFLRQLHGPDPALTASLGTADAVLVAAYIGGRVWQRFYGPLGPSIPIDRLGYLLSWLVVSFLKSFLSKINTDPSFDSMG